MTKRGITAAALAVLTATALRAAEADEPLPPGAVARLGSTRWQPGGDIYAVAFSPDGTRAVTVGEWARVCVRDADSGRTLSRLDLSPWEPRCAAFSREESGLCSPRW